MKIQKIYVLKTLLKLGIVNIALSKEKTKWIKCISVLGYWQDIILQFCFFFFSSKNLYILDFIYFSIYRFFLQSN